MRGMAMATGMACPRRCSHRCVKKGRQMVTWHHSDLVPPKLGLGLIFGLDIDLRLLYINHDIHLKLQHLLSSIHLSIYITIISRIM
jgi:hypothetical protein